MSPSDGASVEIILSTFSLGVTVVHNKFFVLDNWKTRIKGSGAMFVP